jgi:hypothetical protein
VSRVVPKIDLKARVILQDALRELEAKLQSVSRSNAYRFPLSSLSFQKIFTVRLGPKQTKFYDNLNAVLFATYEQNISAYCDAIDRHSFHIAAEVLTSFADVDPWLLADRVGSIAKLAWAFIRELIPNARSGSQVRSCFRVLRETRQSGA